MRLVVQGGAAAFSRGNALTLEPLHFARLGKNDLGCGARWNAAAVILLPKVKLLFIAALVPA